MLVTQKASEQIRPSRIYRLQQVTENEQHRSINIVADSKCYKDPSWGGDPEQEGMLFREGN